MRFRGKNAGRGGATGDIGQWLQRRLSVRTRVCVFSFYYNFSIKRLLNFKLA